MFLLFFCINDTSAIPHNVKNLFKGVGQILILHDKRIIFCIVHNNGLMPMDTQLRLRVKNISW